MGPFFKTPPPAHSQQQRPRCRRQAIDTTPRPRHDQHNAAKSKSATPRSITDDSTTTTPITTTITTTHATLAPCSLACLLLLAVLAPRPGPAAGARRIADGEPPRRAQ